MDLNVLLSNRLAGYLGQDAHGHPTFRYADSWRQTPGAYPLSLALPLTENSAPAATLSAVLWGLLPDNEALLQRWASRFHVSSRNPVALLSHVGEDCAGAVQFVRGERLAAVLAGEDDRQEPLSLHEVAQRLQRIRVDQIAARQPDDVGQFSLAGAQPKIALMQRDDGGWAIPAGRIPTTHILKPPSGDYDGFVENEVFCLRLASQLGMSAASTEMICMEDAQAIAVTRFDRVRTAQGWQRVHQEDFCQALGVMPHIKYQNQGGPGPADLARVLWEHSSKPRADVERLLQALQFNYLIGGTDAHAKNYSLLIGAQGNVRLAPLYDISSALPYAHLQQRKIKMAMKIGSHYRWWDVRLADWEATADGMTLDPQKALSGLFDMATRLPGIARALLAELQAEGMRHPVLERLVDGISASCQRCLRQFEQSAT